MTNTEMFELISEINKCPILKETFLKALKAVEKQTTPPKKEPERHLYNVQVEFSLLDDYEVFAFNEEHAKEIAADIFVENYGYDCYFGTDDVTINSCERV